MTLIRVHCKITSIVIKRANPLKMNQRFETRLQYARFEIIMEVWWTSFPLGDNGASVSSWRLEGTCYFLHVIGIKARNRVFIDAIEGIDWVGSWHWSSEDSDLRDNWLFDWVLHLRTASAETGFNRFSVSARTVAGRIGSPVLVLCIGAPAEASC